MALLMLMLYCMLLLRLTAQMIRFGKELLGARTAFLIAPVLAIGAYLCIMVTLGGGLILLAGATLLTIGATLVFAE